MSFWDNIFTGKKSSAAGSAKQRLKFVLVHDRTEIPPGMLELIKDDIIAVISRRIAIDRENVAVHINHGATEGKLLVDIPLLQDTEERPGRMQGTAKRSLKQ
jgi:cell division topological specificity factor